MQSGIDIDEDPMRHIRRLGGEGVLKLGDLPSLTAGVLRVTALLSDHEWHTADQVRWAAGTGHRPASEGLRRLREIRAFAPVWVKRGEGRDFLYRIPFAEEIKQQVTVTTGC